MIKSIESHKPLLLVAHPGHELLVYGWMSKAHPTVCVLTDGSGHHASSRLNATADLLAATGAMAGPLFGRFTDREMYAVLLERRTGVIASAVDELAAWISDDCFDVVVTDAMEGFNPVHDLCRVMAGAACELAGVQMQRYEFPIHAAPRPASSLSETLDDSTLVAKLSAARAMEDAIPDIGEMLLERGAEAFRTESFTPAAHWTVPGWKRGERPLYEQIGEERVASGRYESVIRYSDHFQPLIDTLLRKLKCAS